MTPELHLLCTGVADSEWELVGDWGDETDSSADAEFTPGTYRKNAEPRRYVAVRIKKRQGLLFSSGYDLIAAPERLALLLPAPYPRGLSSAGYPSRSPRSELA